MFLLRLGLHQEVGGDRGRPLSRVDIGDQDFEIGLGVDRDALHVNRHRKIFDRDRGRCRERVHGGHDRSRRLKSERDGLQGSRTRQRGFESQIGRTRFPSVVFSERIQTDRLGRVL